MSNRLLCKSVSKSYFNGKHETKVLNELNLQVSSGELLAIVGSSGCGKSTFLHIAGVLDSPTSGEVIINDVNVHTLADKERAAFRNQHIGFIYQFHHLMMEFSAVENVAMPLLIRGVSPKEAKLSAEKMLSQVSLSHRFEHRPSELSGGERQRVAIARALVTNPSIVLADEPTGNLDFDTAEQIYKLIRELNSTLGTSFIIVTHDLVLASKMDRQLTLSQGQLTPMTVNIDGND